MGILDETRFVERLQFFDGQRLFAEDLQGLEAVHRELRWLHNQSLHQPGIGNGFAVTGERDAREVRVGPGYALDSRGREIVLTREQVEPVPPVASEPDGRSVFFDLVVSYDDDPEAVETRQGICRDRGVVRLREEPVLCFVRLERDDRDNLKPADPKLGQEITAGLRIVLARLEVLDCRLRQTISLAQRRSARPAQQPYLACGEVPILPAELKPVGGFDNLFFLKKLIDTTSGGFQSTPCYSVRLGGTRLKTHMEPGSNPSDPDVEVVDYYILDGTALILDPTASSFTVEALLDVHDFRGGGAGVEPPPPEFPDGWTVHWMGFE